MSQTVKQDVAEQLCARIDLDRAGLQDIKRLYDEGSVGAAAIEFVAYLRARRTPRLGWERPFISELRRRATPEQKDAAHKKLTGALQERLITTGHRNAISSLGAETLFLGATEDTCRRIGERVLELRAEWSEGPWGNTRGAAELIAWMMAVPECPDAAIVPLLGWLTAQADAEWNWSRTWNESMLGSSGHNWFLHTYLGFYLAGLWFPELEGFEQWRSLAPEYFEHEMSVLMKPDGWTRERSGYHYGTVQLFLDYLHIAEMNDVHMSPQFYERLRAVGASLWKVLPPDGGFPAMGDCGKAHRPGGGLERLRKVAALLQIPEAKWVADRLAPDWSPPYEGFLPASGRNVLPEYDRVPLHAPDTSTADTVLPDSGYYFMRENWTPTADYLWIEAGPLGSIVDSHNHTHIFDFELYSRGRPILIDNCSGAYGDTPERLWRVGSFSHNVATVDGRHHLPIENEWRWETQTVPFVNAWKSEEKFAYFSGAHEAYRGALAGVESCRRKLFYLRGQYWILIDRFTARPDDATHEYTLHFQVNPPSQLGEDGRLTTEGEGGNLLMVPVEGARGEAAIEPCPFPVEGYDNPDHLTYTSQAKGGHLLVTLLVPFPDRDVPEISVQLLQVECDNRTLDPWEATALEIVLDGRRDLYLDQHMQWSLPWRTGGYEGTGRLFHSACHGK